MRSAQKKDGSYVTKEDERAEICAHIHKVCPMLKIFSAFINLVYTQKVMISLKCYN